jgi:hypothetical protein
LERDELHLLVSDLYGQRLLVGDRGAPAVAAHCKSRPNHHRANMVFIEALR